MIQALQVLAKKMSNLSATQKLQGAQDLIFCILLRLLVKAAQQFN